jgi:hypothetical protein
MKNLLIIIGILLLAVNISAQEMAFSYDATIEWPKVSPETKKVLLDYANAGKYGQGIEVKFDSEPKFTLVKGVKSRSGNIEDQVWVQGSKDGKELNLLLALKDLPKISDRCCVLTISAYRGDSEAISSRGKTKNPGLKRNPW